MVMQGEKEEFQHDPDDSFSCFHSLVVPACCPENKWYYNLFLLTHINII